MSVTPSAVRRAAAAADDLIRKQTQTPTPPVAETPPAAPQAPAATNATSTVQPSPAPTVPPAQPPQPAPVNYEQQYRTLMGKYNSEVPRLRQQVTELTNELQTVKDLLAQRVAAPAPATQPAPPPQPVKLVTDDEVKEYGTDLIDMFRRVAREELGVAQSTITQEVDRRIAPVQQRIDRVAGAVESTHKQVVRRDRESVLAALAEAVPNFQAMDTDPGFLEWLDQRDPFSGKARGVLLTEAFQAFDAPRVIAFFTGYLREHAMVTPPENPQPTPQQPPASAATQVTLDSLVAPGTPKAGAPRTPDGSEQKRIWTPREIAKFYELKRRKGGLKGMTLEEIAAVDADIIAAGREGRIR